MGRLMAGIGLIVLVGIPLGAYIWETLNELLAGHVDTPRLLWLVPALVLGILLLRFMSRQVQRWEGERGDSVAEPRSPGPRNPS